MYGIFTDIYHKNQPNVGVYTIHGSYGVRNPETLANMENLLLISTGSFPDGHTGHTSGVNGTVAGRGTSRPLIEIVEGDVVVVVDFVDFVVVVDDDVVDVDVDVDVVLLVLQKPIRS